jgi:hypothetical protein
VGYHESQVKKVCQEEEVINFVKLKWDVQLNEC